MENEQEAVNECISIAANNFIEQLESIQNFFEVNLNDSESIIQIDNRAKYTVTVTKTITPIEDQPYG